MPLLILPLVLLLVLFLAVILLPVSLVQRFRYGRARRRAWPWLVSFNFWFLLVASALFLLVSALMQWWFPHNLLQAGLGWLAGVALGIIALWLTRYERAVDGLYYTPNVWLVLSLTLLVAGRLLVSLVQIYRQGSAWWSGGHLSADWHAGLVAVAGLLLGYALAYQWGLRRRLRRLAPPLSSKPFSSKPLSSNPAARRPFEKTKGPRGPLV